MEAFAWHLGRELQGGGAGWIDGHREVAGAGGGEGLALQEQRQSPGDLLAVAIHRGVSECCGVAAIGTGHLQLDLIAGLEGALQLQLADLGHAGIAGAGQNTEGHPGHQALKQQGVGRGGVGAGLEEGSITAADGLAGIEPSHQLLHRLLLDLGLVAAEAREGEREHLGIAAAGAVEQTEIEGVAIAVGAQQLQGCGLGHGADRRRADGGIGREGEGSGAAQFAAEQMHPAGPQGGEQNPVVGYHVVGIGGQGQATTPLGIDAAFDQVVGNARHHAIDREAVLLGGGIGLHRVGDHLAL